MAVINCKESSEKMELSKRPTLDLFCVIDKSGSMSGEKI
jgi:hypothetical protein